MGVSDGFDPRPGPDRHLTVFSGWNDVLVAEAVHQSTRQAPYVESPCWGNHWKIPQHWKIIGNHLENDGKIIGKSFGKSLETPKSVVQGDMLLVKSI